MNRINVTIHLKQYDKLNDEDLLNLTKHMNRSKADLMCFVSYFGSSSIYNLLNDFISNQDDVETFVNNYFKGDYQGLIDDAETSIMI